MASLGCSRLVKELARVLEGGRRRGKHGLTVVVGLAHVNPGISQGGKTAVPWGIMGMLGRKEGRGGSAGWAEPSRVESD